MTSWLIQGGRIIDPAQRVDEGGSLLIADGKISWRGGEDQAPPISDYVVLPARGLVVCPGFVDLHCHLREPGFEAKETVATGTRAAVRGGFTTICCMANTDPPLDSVSTIDYVRKKARLEGVVRVLPIACITRGRQGKELVPMAELAAAGAVGFSDDGSPVLSLDVMRQALELSRALGLPVIDHCEDTGLTSEGVINEGRISLTLGLPGMPAMAEETMVARDLKLAENTGGWLHVAHVSTAGSVELIRQAKKKGVRVTAEVTPHHLTMTEERVMECGALAKVNPPLRTAKDAAALVEGLKEGVIDIIATDHAPHAQADKQGGMGQAAFGISGLETALGSLMMLVHEGKLDLPTLIARLTCYPARILGDRHGELGSLAIGAPADITILDPQKEWLVDTRKFASKGKNTPWAGFVLKGEVVTTIYGGRLVFRDDSIVVDDKGLAPSKNMTYGQFERKQSSVK